MNTISTQNAKTIKEPAYIDALYASIYKNKKNFRFLDDQRVQSILTCGMYKMMLEDVLEDIGTNSSVLQIGCTFGNQMEQTAEKVGKYGQYVIADVLNTSLDAAREKLIGKKVDFKLHDARKPFDGSYDTVICWMLLHELPEISRQKVINNALNAVKDGGKAIFIDYNRPSDFNLLRFILKPFNRLFFPFAESLWKTPIKNYAQKQTHFSWYKKTFGAKMYQKVVAVRRVSDVAKPETKQSFY